jgi:hypothetical protein
MASDQVVTLNALMGATLALMLAMRGVPAIHIDLPALTWNALSTAEPCFVSDPNGCMLGP